MRAGIAVLAALGMVALGLWPPAFLQRGLGDGTPSTLLDILVLPTEPYVLIPVVALTAGFQVIRRRWRETAFCVAATAVPIALNTWVLKPLFGHELRGDLAYPSGHTVSLVATLIVLIFLTRQWLLAIVAAAVTAAAGIGLVGLGYHYPVDILGGACLAVAAVFTLSLVMRPGRARSAGSPHASTSSGNPPPASPE